MIYPQPQQNPYMGMSMQPAQYQPPIQSSLINVRGEQEARNYPTAHGASLTFKDENGPYLYTKTLGFSQMDVPVFEKFRLEKVADLAQDTPQVSGAGEYSLDDLKAEMGQMRGQIDALKKDVKGLLSFKAEFGGDEHDQ